MHRPLLALAVLAALAAPAQAQDCVPDAASDVRVVGRGERAGPLTIPAGRLCADLHGERRDARDVSIQVGVGNFGTGNGLDGAGVQPGGTAPIGRSGAAPLYESGVVRRAPRDLGSRTR